MHGQRYWIRQGRLEADAKAPDGKQVDDHAQFLQGAVRMTTGELGTEIKWHVNSPCIASVFTAIEHLAVARTPIMLRFLAIGWFEETFASVVAAKMRLEEILARGDRYFTGRIFTKELEPLRSSLPEVLRESLGEREPPPDYSVDCTFDTARKLFVVDRVGPKSAIGRVWGTFTSSYPCQPAGSYGDNVSATYEQVLRDGRPRYDHVLAALRLPDNALHWIPYHRLILPRLGEKGQPGVAIVSQIASVDIRVL